MSKKNDLNILARNIKHLRKTLQLTQTEFGERLGVSRFVISHIEQAYNSPSDTLLVHIHDIYGVDLRWLTTGEGEMFETDLSKLSEAYRLFLSLRPELQDYVLDQIKHLLQLQKEIK